MRFKYNGSIMLRRIKLHNLLSFGPTEVDLELRPLNVLIGPNASGKSNFIDAIGLLAATPGDLSRAIKDGGGVGDWLWRGAARPTAKLEVVIDNPGGKQPIRHGFKFTQAAQRFEMVDEWVENERPYTGKKDAYFYYRFQNGHPVLNSGNGKARPRSLLRESINPEQSILAQRADAESYPEIFFLAGLYKRIGLYRDWSFGRTAPFRMPQKTDERNDRLLESSLNLALMVNKLKRNAAAKRRLLELIGTFIEGVTDVDVQIEGGTAQLVLEEGSFSIPATRLSDGTLRFLSLLAVLLNPTPPPLVCIEEPELGLHPDAITILGDLLIEASNKMQLIVTTHSDVLLDAMSEDPESVVVCDRVDGITRAKRLEEKALRPLLTDHTLSSLWNSGEIGGNRW
jgi:predicted ATPase